MYQSRNLNRTCKGLVALIDDELSRSGVFLRIFSRVKSSISTDNKIKSKGHGYYNGETKFLRDIIGIRVILYFSDDVDIVCKRLQEFFELVEETIDVNKATEFAPTRINLVFRIPENSIKEFSEIVDNPIIDTTFEVQLRTILSEGWHEVDHDLRYKCQEDWTNNTDLARNFNGILAAIETSEYSTIRLFDQLSYRHYQSKDLIAMLRTKFRIRLADYHISKKLFNLIDANILREIYKIERTDFIKSVFESTLLTPINIEVLIYLLNYWFVKDVSIIEITPKELLYELS